MAAIDPLCFEAVEPQSPATLTSRLSEPAYSLPVPKELKIPPGQVENVAVLRVALIFHLKALLKALLPGVSGRAILAAILPHPALVPVPLVHQVYPDL